MNDIAGHPREGGGRFVALAARLRRPRPWPCLDRVPGGRVHAAVTRPAQPAVGTPSEARGSLLSAGASRWRVPAWDAAGGLGER
jgi:hypothetical protein